MLQELTARGITIVSVARAAGLSTAATWQQLHENTPLTANVRDAARRLISEHDARQAEHIARLLRKRGELAASAACLRIAREVSA